MTSGPVLIVDDEEEIRFLVGAFAREIGMTTHEAADGADALARLEAGLRPDAMVLDLGMPRMSGLVCLQNARAHLPCLPVVMLTGHYDQRSVMAALKLGAFDFLEKPFSRDALTESLSRAVAYSELVRKTEAEIADVCIRASLPPSDAQRLRTSLLEIHKMRIAREFLLKPRE